MLGILGSIYDIRQSALDPTRYERYNVANIELVLLLLWR